MLPPRDASDAAAERHAAITPTFSPLICRCCAVSPAARFIDAALRASAAFTKARCRHAVIARFSERHYAERQPSPRRFSSGRRRSFSSTPAATPFFAAAIRRRHAAATPFFTQAVICHACRFSAEAAPLLDILMFIFAADLITAAFDAAAMMPPRYFSPPPFSRYAVAAICLRACRRRRPPSSAAERRDGAVAFSVRRRRHRRYAGIFTPPWPSPAPLILRDRAPFHFIFATIAMPPPLMRLPLPPPPPRRRH